MDVWKAYKAPELTRFPVSSSTPVRAASAVVEAANERAERSKRDAERSVTTVAISKDADFLKKLSALQQSDATQFKHLLGELGSNLKAAANSPSGEVGSELGDLADRLLLAAKTGDLSSLKPEQSAQPRPPPATQTTQLASAAASIVGSGASLGIANAALSAYRRNAPQALSQSEIVSQARDYVLAAVTDAVR